MNPTMKLWKRVIEQELIQETIKTKGNYAWEVNLGSNILPTTIDGVVQKE